MGSAASSWNVYGQSNETDFQSENVIQNISKPSMEEDKGNIDGQITSDKGSSGNDSGIGHSQIIAGESNTPKLSANSQPDGDCLFDPTLSKCAPDENGNCPKGFYMNENEQCFPAHDRCPSGYHSHEDDESGKCIPDSVPCDPGYIMNPDFPTCEYKEYLCQNYPDLKECKADDNGRTTKVAYNSGYNHGCSDAKISDPSNRYINQQGKGPNYHTPDFMSGYHDGFEICSNGNNSQAPP